MSKSKGNVINPDDMVKAYGADALRVYEMFIGDYEHDASWSENGLKGCKRFLDRIERIADKLIDKNDINSNLEIIFNQTIKKVTDDILTMNYNTAVSALMILLNKLDEQETITKKEYRIILHLLNPIAPHITEELNEQYNLGPRFVESQWPTYDSNKLVSNEKEIGVQVNGKLRASIKVMTDENEESIKAKALQEENVQKHLENKEIVKIIIIPNRIVNIVVK